MSKSPSRFGNVSDSKLDMFDLTPRALGNKLGAWERCFDKEDIAVTVELETPFLLVVHLVGGERLGEREGRERKRRKAGRSSLLGITSTRHCICTFTVAISKSCAESHNTCTMLTRFITSQHDHSGYHCMGVKNSQGIQES